MPAVAARWPEVVVESHIDRQRLGSIVFGDPGQLAELEAITHPYIFGRIRSELEGFDGVAVVEVPVLGSGLEWPRIVVDAEDELRLERAMKRGLDREKVLKRMRSQPTRGDWLAAADVVIPNPGSLAELEKTVARALPYLSGD